jgi:hypothetical protein
VELGFFHLTTSSFSTSPPVTYNGGYKFNASWQWMNDGSLPLTGTGTWSQSVFVYNQPPPPQTAQSYTAFTQNSFAPPLSPGASLSLESHPNLTVYGPQPGQPWYVTVEADSQLIPSLRFRPAFNLFLN